MSHGRIGRLVATDPLLVTGGVVLLGLGVFHSVLGEIYILRRLFRRDNLPKLFDADTFTKCTIRFAWHLLTIACVGLSALLFLPTDAGDPSITRNAVLWIVFWTMTACGAWGIVSTRGRHLAWVVFFGIAPLVLLGGGLGT